MKKDAISLTHPAICLSGLCFLVVACTSSTEDPATDAQSPTETGGLATRDADFYDSLPPAFDAGIPLFDAPHSDAPAATTDAAVGDGNAPDGNSFPPNLATATVVFPAADGLPITADLYIAHPLTAPFIILAHRASWSRGEYLEIAPKLNSLGFNAMAIDLRAGKEKNGVSNATNAAAVAASKPTLYLDALPDWQAAVTYAKENFAEGKLILWGSSFSSSLAIAIAKDNPTTVDGLVCFAPGEYFANMYGKTATWVQETAALVNQPVFFTSKRSECDDVRKAIFNAIPSTTKTYFVPEAEGKHGSEALYASNPNHAEYWTALTTFLALWMPGTP